MNQRNLESTPILDYGSDAVRRLVESIHPIDNSEIAFLRLDSFVRGDQLPLSTFGFRPAWSTLRARRSKSTSGKHPIIGTWMKVAAGRKQPETARGNSGQPATSDQR